MSRFLGPVIVGGIFLALVFGPTWLTDRATGTTEPGRCPTTREELLRADSLRLSLELDSLRSELERARRQIVMLQRGRR